MKSKSMYFEMQMIFDDDAIFRLFRAEYFTYETWQRILRFVLGAAGILAALFAELPTGVRVLILMIGVWLLVAGDFPSKIQAQGVIEKRKGQRSQVVYQFEASGIRIRGGGCIPYQALDKLVYDDEYFYLFVSRQNAVMFRADALEPQDLEQMKALIEKESGRTWKRLTAGFLEYNIRDLLQAADSRKDRK